MIIEAKYEIGDTVYLVSWRKVGSTGDYFADGSTLVIGEIRTESHRWGTDVMYTHEYAEDGDRLHFECNCWPTLEAAQADAARRNAEVAEKHAAYKGD